MTNAEKINASRYDKLAYRLNHDAYMRQLEQNRGRPLKQFIPCPKALILTAALSITPIPVTQLVIPKAGRELCVCHPGLNEIDLYKMMQEIQIEATHD